MFTNFFFNESLTSLDLINDLEYIFNDAEGFFPAEQLEVYISSNSISLDQFLYDLVRYAVFRGTEIASQESFFLPLESNLTNPVPGIVFWRAYDALIRGNIEQFEKLWTVYGSIELKNYDRSFIFESIVIPEDPIFLNVETFVHDHQQRILKTFVHSQVNEKDLPNEEYDKLLQNFLGDYSLLLSFFRLFQASFERNISFKDLDNLLALITEENIESLGPYWESRFLATICYWKVNLGLVFDVVENLTRLKNLNSDACNYLLDSQIFHIEALMAFKNNSPDSHELLNSAYFVAKEYHFFYQSVEVLLTKLELEPDSIFQTAKTIFSLTSEQHHSLIHAKIYALLGTFFIQQQNWSEAEKNLLQSSKLVQGTYDKKTYYQVIADFTYVLVVTRQLHEALEASTVLLDDNISILYRIRGFYLYGLTLLLLDRKSESIEILEEGIRIALSHDEHISLPWFYELLELIYVSLQDIENAPRYSNLTSKAYFDSSSSEGGYRSKIINSYLLALDKDYGRSLTQISGLLSEISAPEIQIEFYSALETIFLGSQEQIPLPQFSEVWQSIENLDSDSKMVKLITFKKSLIEKINPITFPKEILERISDESFKERSIEIECLLLGLLYLDSIDFSLSTFFKYRDLIVQTLSSLKVKFISINYTLDTLKKIFPNDASNNLQNVNLTSDDKAALFTGIYTLALLRIVLENLPFNFLTDNVKQ